MLITRSCLLGLVSVPATWLVAAWLALTLADGNAPDRARIELAPAADSRWQATYTFTEPVEELHFARAARFHRETVWQVSTPGYAFARRDGRQLLVRETGAVPARVVRFEIPVHTDNLEKDYALFAAFTDGSVAIYTGYFHAAATATRTAPEAVSETEFVRDFRLMPAPGMAVVAGGRRESPERTEALNACLQDLAGMALQEAAANDRFGAYYSCGQVVSMWVQAALERVRAAVDPFLVWRRVLEQALADDGDYDRGTFHNTLAELGVAPAVRADLREFTETRLADPAAFLDSAKCTAAQPPRKPWLDWEV